MREVSVLFTTLRHSQGAAKTWQTYSIPSPNNAIYSIIKSSLTAVAFPLRGVCCDTFSSVSNVKTFAVWQKLVRTSWNVRHWVPKNWNSHWTFQGLTDQETCTNNFCRRPLRGCSAGHSEAASADWFEAKRCWAGGNERLEWKTNWRSRWRNRAKSTGKLIGPARHNVQLARVTKIEFWCCEVVKVLG